MAAGRSNGRTPASQQASHQSSSVDDTTSALAAEGLLQVSSQLSRKLQWAIATSWEAATGHKAPRGLVQDLTSKYTVEITLALAGRLPLHLGHPPPPDPQSAPKGA